MGVELLPGVLFLCIYVTAAKDWLSEDAALPLSTLTVFGGGGWLVAGRLGTGCLIAVLRIAVAAVVVLLALEAFSNESACYTDSSNLGECYEQAIQRFDVALIAYIVLPFASAILLVVAVRSAPWQSVLKRPLSHQRILFTSSRFAVGSMFLVGLPFIVGVAYSSTGHGRATLTVRNETGYQLYAFTRPGHGRGNDIEVGVTTTISPQFARFDDPREVTFVATNGEGVSTYWNCEWSFAKQQEPIVIDWANTAGCQTH